MTIELYAAPQSANPLSGPESPVSNVRGELPADEPTFDLKDLLGTFDSREEAIAFIEQQLVEENAEVTNQENGPFNDYIHVEWLTITTTTGDQPEKKQGYYLVTDEGY
jgi:hypothetical protein